MAAPRPNAPADSLRKIGFCLLPVLLGAGGALVLLVVASGPTRPAYAGTLTFPGCAATIQGCIDIANPGDTILISAGDYNESLTLSKVVSLTGALSSTTILHALPNTRVLTVTGAAVGSSVVISGLTLAGGHAVGGACPDGCGGALLLTADAQPVLINLTISNSLAEGSGGGVYADTGSPLVMWGVAVLSNTSMNNGGGAFARSNVTLFSVLYQNNECITPQCGGGGLLSTGNLVVSNTQFLSNRSGDAGGAVLAIANTDLINSLFVDNQCRGDDSGFCAGGGLQAGNLAVTNTAFLSNTSTSIGGGAFAFGKVTLNGVLFQNNQCAGVNCQGGGLMVDGSLKISGTQFVNNTGTGMGGALLFGGGPIFGDGALTVTNSLFLGNSAQQGAGLFEGGGDALLINDLFAANQASGQGDALYLSWIGAVSLLHTTIASPTLGSNSAVFVADGALGITDTIIASYTTGISQTGGSVFQDYNLFFDASANTLGVVSGGAHSRTGDPAFANPGAGNFHLSPGSLAIDAGTNAGVTTDFEGDPRPLGNGFDIGFDESLFTAVADVGVAKSVSAGVQQPGQRLTYTLVYSNAGPDAAGGVRLTDILPANLTAVTYTSSGAALTPVGPGHYAWQVANLAPGAGGVVTVTGVLSGGLHGSVFTNTATITTGYSDTNPANNSSAVSFTVANVAPVGAGDVYTVTTNSTLTVTAPGVLRNDTDANSDALTVTLATGPVTGTLNLHADGSFTYAPAHGFTGVVTFKYRANDGLADSNTVMVTITVAAASYKLYLPVVLRP
jgi:uncharacterized repeat protein (TIGR01451 family)